MIISLTREKTEAIEELMLDHWSTSTRRAIARDVLSMTGKLWNLTYVVRAGSHFVWRPLRLTGLHDERDTKNQNLVGLGREFHADFLFWKWAKRHKLLPAGETVVKPCYTALKRSAKQHYLYPMPASNRLADIASTKYFSGDPICRPN